jgi:hypothetical protein
MIRVGVIGYGYWGPNLVRNFAEAPECGGAGCRTALAGGGAEARPTHF